MFAIYKKLFSSLTIPLLAALLLAACAPAAAPAPTATPIAGVALPGILVETEWLAQHLEQVRVVDVRSAARYQEGHIPGAVNLALSEITISDPVAGMLAPPEQVARVMGGLGISNSSSVVIYDDSRSLSASRLFWALEYYGHGQAAILNGGYPKWLAESRESTRVAPQVASATFTARADVSRVATKQWILDNLKSSGVVLLDVRSPQEYSGQDVRARRGGHIPGAVNIDWTQSVTTGQVPVFKSAAELTALYRGAGVTPDQEVVTYCQTGVRAAHTYFVLRLLGYNKVRNYDGSWEEWGNDPQTPVEK